MCHCHVTPCHADSCHFVFYSSLLNCPTALCSLLYFSLSWVIIYLSKSVTNTWKCTASLRTPMLLFSCQRNCLLTATPSFLSITIYKPTGGHLLPPENWQKPSLFSKQKARYSIKSFSESQVLWIVGTFMDIPNMGYLLYKELPNSSALSLEKRQQERVMKEVCKIKSIVTKRMRSKELPHCFLKANSWNEARVKPQSQAQHYQEEVSHHTVAVDVVEARIYRLQGEDGKVQRYHFQLRLSPS